ncbi:MAG: SDR family NAD(P)-dependent oxidoreductase [Halioglobus sp.]|nr:SDR family NAD(P)-dependent oxidoreductase [Halioglobus sp.]
MAADKTKVWLITGCSTGFGREIALCALAQGERVAVTARRLESVADICRQFPDRALALQLDITDPNQRSAALRDTLDRFGELDVLVNNAGYTYVAAIEEGEEAEFRAMFETNFFATLEMTRLVLPYFRERRRGRILNNSSQAGLMGNPGTGFYSSSKYALEGLMEALTKEVAPFGIQVVSVQPGAFRTENCGRSLQRSACRVPDYEDTVGQRLDMIAAIDGRQPGDPVRGAQIFVKLGTMENPPATLILGAGVLQTYREKLEGIQQHLQEWESVSISADYPPDETATKR